MGDLGRVDPVVPAEEAGQDGDEELMAIEDEAFERAQREWEDGEAGSSTRGKRG
jgi:hypothetical protein